MPDPFKPTKHQKRTCDAVDWKYFIYKELYDRIWRLCQETAEGAFQTCFLERDCNPSSCRHEVPEVTLQGTLFDVILIKEQVAT